MRIRTSWLASATAATEPDECAVVIDVLRATSVMATAIAAGARRIITCREIAEAQRIAAAMNPRPLLCGERHCVAIPGFDLANSPGEYSSDRIADKTLVLTTTNGTAAIEAARGAQQVLIASYLNLAATVRALAATSAVHVICAGTDRRPADEDISLAGALIERCQTEHGAVLDRDSHRAVALWQTWSDQKDPHQPDWLVNRLRETQGGRNLIAAGLETDIQRCARLDTLEVCPRRVARDPATFQ